MFKKVFKSFSVYTLTSVVSAVLSLIILPVLTKYLSQKDYGITALFSTYVMIATPFIGISAGSKFWLNFFKGDTYLSLSKFYSTYFWFSGFTTICIASFLFVLSLIINDTLFYSFLFLLLIPVTAFISVIGEDTRSYFVNNKLPGYFFLYSLCIVGIELSLSYVFVVYLFKNWEGRIFAWIISLVIQFLFTIWILGIRKKYLKFSFDFGLIKQFLVFGYPLIFHQLGKFVINQSDRLFITNMVSIDAAGIYSIGYQVGSMLLLPITAFTNFYSPFVYERLANITENKKIEIVKVSYYFIIVILIAFGLVVGLAPLFFKIFIDYKFNTGLAYVFWVALAYVFWGFYMLFAVSIFFKQRTKILGYLSIFNVFLNSLLNYLLIKKLGPIGAAYATTISFFVVFCITVYFSNKFYKLPWLYFVKKNQQQ